MGIFQPTQLCLNFQNCFSLRNDIRIHARFTGLTQREEKAVKGVSGDGRWWKKYESSNVQIFSENTIKLYTNTFRKITKQCSIFYL